MSAVPREIESELIGEELVARIDALRGWLLEAQAATEERSFYSEELHEALKDGGFYRLHAPTPFGGLEQIHAGTRANMIWFRP